MTLRRQNWTWAAMMVLLGLAAAMAGRCPAAPSADTIVVVFDQAVLETDPSVADGVQREGVLVFDEGRVVETTVELPPMPENQRDARRIVATVVVEPTIVEKDDKLFPGDRWTRLGSISLVPAKPSTASGVAATQPASPLKEVELLRFITGFGGSATYTHDLTPLAPLLHGTTTLRAFVSTYAKPAWKLSLTLRYTAEGVGCRRPVWAQPLLLETHVTATTNKLHATVNVPSGLALPRLHILSSGHATDGAAGDEFTSRTHVLRIDDKEVARWRPWAEEGGTLRAGNPAAGKRTIDGREIWSSDDDRAGWHPGLLVEPLRIPLPELTPGWHRIELEILKIRPKDEQGHGYWRISAIVVADEPWPVESQGASRP